VFGRLMPQEGRFFELFNQHAGEIVAGGRELVAMMSGEDDLERRAHNIETIEKRGDKLVRQTLLLLHRTFITPLDRNEIHALITQMDNILDVTEEIAHAMFLYDVKEVTAEARELAGVCLAGAEKVSAAVSLLDSGANTAKVMKICEEIDRLEAEADHIMRAAMARLFREEPDVLRVIKLKELYELLEGLTDRCEDVANVIESIVLERA
jgi:predicted phosphate transport protein (TIGR00153 family)